MRKLGIFALGLLLLSCRLWANPDNFDIFGVDEQTKQKIYSCCSGMFVQYLNESKKMNLLSTEPSEKDMVHRLKFEERIISRIKQIDDFSEVKLSVIYYPVEQKTFGTLDIVKVSDIDRIPGKKKVVRRTKIVLSQGAKKLFRIWKEYDEQNMKLIRENKLDLNKTSCPTTHCTWGFDEESIKNILPKIQEGVAKNKHELFNIIKHSADDNVRGDAIFILANDNHHQELAEFLINFTDDPSDLVRNNVMRVLGAIVAKYKVDNLKVERITQALNYPYVTDRNKAAYILLGIIKSDPETHTQVINQAGQTIVELLKLKQPNNHDFAYQILRELSHKNYDEHDYRSWSKWINDKQNIKH